MTPLAIARPEATTEFYPPYYGGYISLVPGDDILATLEQQLSSAGGVLASIDEHKANFRYAPGKWTIKELLGHVVDTERIFAYRILRFARNDHHTPIEGYDQDLYARFSPYARLPWSVIVEELRGARQSTLQLLHSLDSEAWMRRGVANQHEITVRALAYVIAGHLTHHLNVLKEKYLA